MRRLLEKAGMPIPNHMKSVTELEMEQRQKPTGTGAGILKWLWARLQALTQAQKEES